MKTYLSFVTLLLLFSCSDNDIAKDTPSCVKKIIEDLKKEDVSNPAAKIYRYQYEDRTVYYIPPKCCDIPGRLLDEYCTLICNPDGGLSGAGDGKCTDFSKKAIDQELIWEDSRGK